MIIDKSIDLVMNNYIKTYYINLGYEIPKIRDSKINVKIEHLYKNSNVKINCACDICKKELMITYQSYNKYIDNQGYYACNKCSQDKKKKTKLKEHGCENYINIEKIRETCLKNYGVNHYSKTDDFQKKIKKTNNERYGVEYSFQSEKIKEKIKKTNNERYGVDNPTQNEELLLKSLKNGRKIHFYKDTNIYYQGTYELDFLENFYHIGIERCKSIKYGNKIYFPDFFFPKLNLIIEIKSEYTYKLHETKNLNKQKSCLEQGYNFIFIIDKDYTEFEKIIF
jgi:hypothetical protein